MYIYIYHIYIHIYQSLCEAGDDVIALQLHEQEQEQADLRQASHKRSH